MDGCFGCTPFQIVRAGGELYAGWGKFDSLVALVVASALLANKDEILDDVSASLHQDVTAATTGQVQTARARTTLKGCGK